MAPEFSSLNQSHAKPIISPESTKSCANFAKSLQHQLTTSSSYDRKPALKALSIKLKVLAFRLYVVSWSIRELKCFEFAYTS